MKPIGEPQLSFILKQGGAGELCSPLICFHRFKSSSVLFSTRLGKLATDILPSYTVL